MADSPVRHWAAGVEAGAGAKYAKAPGFRDVIQTVLSWIDSPCRCELGRNLTPRNPLARGIAARGGSKTP